MLLCSDGLSNEVGTDEMVAILEREADPADAARRLVQAANEHGGADNITVVVVDVVPHDDAGSAVVAAVPALLATGAGPTGSPPDPGVPPAPSSRSVRPDDTLVIGSHLGFGAGPSTLAETGPRSDEFFVGSPGSVPLSRSSTRVPPPPPSASVRVPQKETRGERRRRLGIRRRVTPRVIGFLVLLAAVPVAAYYALHWYAYDNWIVTLRGNQVVVEQGQPGGVLWFHPKVVDPTGVTVSRVIPQAVGPLRTGVQKGSLREAKAYVTSITATTTPTIGATTPTTPTSSTTTTAAAP